MSPLTILVRRSIIEVRQDLKYAPDARTIKNVKNVRGLAAINMLIDVFKLVKTLRLKIVDYFHKTLLLRFLKGF